MRHIACNPTACYLFNVQHSGHPGEFVSLYEVEAIKHIALRTVLLCASLTDISQSQTQYFTGVLSTNLPYFANGGASPLISPLFNLPAGSVLSGSFSVNTTGLSLTNSGNDFAQYKGSGAGAGSFTVSDGQHTMTLNGLAGAGFNFNELAVGWNDSRDLSVGANLQIFCSGFAFTDYTLDVFPLTIPSPPPEGMTCTTSVFIADRDPYSGGTYAFTLTIASLSNSAPANPTPAPISPVVPTFIPHPVQILDPVPDLLDGPRITQDPSTLASGGGVVSGIAADGAAQLVFRIPAQAAGDTVTATLLSDPCTDSSAPSTCAPSTSSDNDGGLFTPGTPVTSSSVLPNKATGIVDATSKDAFIAYRAPVDFTRPSQDETASTRNVYVQFSYSSANATTPYYVSTPIPITIIRPPVVLIHGYASDAAETWKYFIANTTTDPRFRMFEVNYGDFIDVKSTTPRLGGLFCERFNNCVTHMRQSDLGFTTSATHTPRVLPDKAVSNQTIDFIANFDAGSNPLGKPVAGVRADVIGHSMGGLIARQWSSQQADYYTDATFGQGYIHKMITLGTPHLGSPLGTLGVQPDSACFRDLSAGNFVKDLVAPARILISSAVLDDGTKDGELVGGAVGELAGDGIDTKGMSPALQFLQTNGSSIPTSKIAGTIVEIPRGLARTAFYLIHHDCNKTDPLARRFTPESYSTIFDPNVFVPRKPGQAGNPEGSSKETFSDGAVPLTSALANPAQGSAACDNYFRFCGYAHGENTQTLTGADHNLVHDDGLIFDRIQDLLNLSVTNTGVWGPQ